MIMKKYQIINNEMYYNFSLSEIEEKINAISSLKASDEQKTLELKLGSIYELPSLVNDNGLRYRKHFNRDTLKVWYEEIS